VEWLEVWVLSSSPSTGKKQNQNQKLPASPAWWYMPEIPAPERPRQHHRIGGQPGYTLRPFLNIKQTKQKVASAVSDTHNELLATILLISATYLQLEEN
jgi:hypothetical protein